MTPMTQYNDVADPTQLEAPPITIWQVKSHRRIDSQIIDAKDPWMAWMHHVAHYPKLVYLDGVEYIRHPTGGLDKQDALEGNGWLT